MTDFLHPQAPQTPDTQEDVLMPQDSSVLNEGEAAEVNSGVDSVQDQSQIEPGAQAGSNQGEPVRKNFASARELQKRSSAPALQQEHEEAKRIIRKESPLFVHYYQSVFLLLITLFVVSGYVVLNPLITEFKKVNKSITVKLEERDSAKSFLNSIDHSIQAAQSISPDTLTKVNEALPKEVQIPKLLQTFAQLAIQDRVTMSGIQFAAQQPDSTAPSYGGYTLVPVQISLSIQAPGYLAMRKYLEDVQTNVRLMDVKSINVSGDGSTGAFSYSLELVSYSIQKNTSSIAPTPAMQGGAIPPSAPSVNDI